ncbi:hypothetical protein BGZ76_010624 [Entomortierella beljakovae]|nr:hypothetical protein BGZ76_010624 [Entomortierella beljakovae]
MASQEWCITLVRTADVPLSRTYFVEQIYKTTSQYFKMNFLNKTRERYLEEANKAIESARNEKKDSKKKSYCETASERLEKAEKHPRRGQKNVGPPPDNEIANAWHSLADICGGLFPDLAKTAHKRESTWGVHVAATPPPVQSPVANVTIDAAAAAAPASTIIPATPVPKLTPATPVAKLTPASPVAKLTPKIFTANDAILVPGKPQIAYPLTIASLSDTDVLAYYISVLTKLLSVPTDDEEKCAEDPKVDLADELKLLTDTSTKVVEEFCERSNNRVISEKDLLEVLHLAAVLEEDNYRKLLGSLVEYANDPTDSNGTTISALKPLEGIAKLLKNDTTQKNLTSSDLDSVVKLLVDRFMSIQTPVNPELIKAYACILDSMVDSQVQVSDQGDLSRSLNDLKNSDISFDIKQRLVYACQALETASNAETPFKKIFRRKNTVVVSASGITTAIEKLNLDEFNSSLNKDSWYLALRGLDALIQENRIDDFEHIVRNAACRMQAEFQWGVCERLYDIAVGASIQDVRKNAVQFLRELYIDQGTWGTDRSPEVNSHIYKTIFHVHQTIDFRKKNDHIADYAQEMLKESIFAEQHNVEFIPHWTKPEASISEELESNQDISKVTLIKCAGDLMENDPGVILRQVNKSRLSDYREEIYIPPRAKPNLNASSDDEFDLMEKVEEFLDGPKKMFLILGDSGAGKSFFIEFLENGLWDKFRKDKTRRIPLYIRLPTIKEPLQDLFGKRLRNLGFNDKHIETLKATREFVFICDGYDEALLTKNLYDENELNTEGGWKGQMMVSCRTDYNPPSYKARFMPAGKEKGSFQNELFQESVIVPFGEDQIKDYIEKYIRTTKGKDDDDSDIENDDTDDNDWDAEKYYKAINEVPDLLDMIKNPFLLKLALEALPGLISEEIVFSTARITRVQLYDEFVIRWSDKSRGDFIQKQSDERYSLFVESVVQGDYKKSCFAYLRDYSTALYVNQGGKPVVDVHTVDEDGNQWMKEYLVEKEAMMSVIPAGVKGSMYDFVHKSVMEYGLSLSVYLPEFKEDDEGSKKTYKHEDIFNDPPIITPSDEHLMSLIATPLGSIGLVDKKSVLQFLAERVLYEKGFEEKLWGIVMMSKTATEPDVLKAAMNSITILVKAGIQFNGKDLKDIKIAGADLSFGVFDSADFENADLRDVTLQNVWLRQANLNGGNMKGVKFGELPYIKAESLVKCCAYEANGTTFGIGLESGEIGLFDTSSWKRQKVLKGHSGPVICIAFSPVPGSKYVASGSYDKSIRVWHLDKGTTEITLTGHEGEVTSVVYSPNGKEIVSGSYDKSVRIWDVETKKQKHAFQGHGGVVTAIMHSPTKPQVASGSFDSGVRVWNTDTGECQFNLEGGHKEKITVVMFSRDGRHLATGSDDKVIKVWDTDDGKLLYEISKENGGHDGGVSSIVYSPIKDEFASGSNDRTIRIWKMEDGSPVKTLKGHDGDVTSIVYSADGSTIASGSDDKTVRLWDVETGTPFHTLQGHTLRVTSVVYCAEIDQIASGSWDKTVRLWNLNASNTLGNTRGHSRKVTSILYSPQGSAVASGSEDHSIRLWKTSTGRSVHNLKKHKAKVTCLAFSRDERQFASGSEDGTVEIWNVYDGINIGTLRGHTREVNSVAYSNRKDQLATGSWDSTVGLWDINPRDKTSELKVPEKTHVLKGHTLPVTTVVYSPVDGTIATGSWDNTVRLWKDGDDEDEPEEDEDIEVERDEDGVRIVKTVKELRVLRGHTKWVNSVVFSGDGAKIASGSHDKTVRIWNTEDGESLHELTGHSLGVISVSFSVDGDQVASGSLDKTVRLWDVENGTVLFTLQGHTAMISSVSYSPFGDIVASRSDDNSVKIWSTKKDQNLVTISSSNGGINGIAWDKRTGVDGHYIATGCEDKSVRRWMIKKDEKSKKDEYKAHLGWSSSHELLTVNEVSLDDHHGLSRLNWMLLSQRGAGLTQSVPPE